MKRYLFIFTSFILIAHVLIGRQVDTFYGPIEVEEPVLLELIDCEALQRLKKIHQYGVAYYTTHREEYTRYDHSLGVFAILRKENASLKEQIAGLLHDISHTVFSHVGDWIFGAQNQDRDYQNQIHSRFLKERGIADILMKYGYIAEEMQPIQAFFPLLECPLPSLCADRIDYNIQGAYHQGFLSYEEALLCFHRLKYTNGVWVSDDLELMKKLANFSFFMSETCWGSPANYLQSRWLADAILRACDLGVLTNEEIHFGIDDTVWNLLKINSDSYIQEKMYLLEHIENVYRFASLQDADQIIKSKFRGIDPWIRVQEGVFRLTEIEPEIAREFCVIGQRCKMGWPIKLQPVEFR